VWVEKDYYPHVYFGCYDTPKMVLIGKWKDCIIFIGLIGKLRIGRKSQVVRKMDSDARSHLGGHRGRVDVFGLRSKYTFVCDAI